MMSNWILGGMRWTEGRVDLTDEGREGGTDVGGREGGGYRCRWEGRGKIGLIVMVDGWMEAIGGGRGATRNFVRGCRQAAALIHWISY